MQTSPSPPQSHEANTTAPVSASDCRHAGDPRRRGATVTILSCRTVFVLCSRQEPPTGPTHEPGEAMPANVFAPQADRPTVVLVHGAFAESSSWNGVVSRLQSEGLPVLAIANPLRGLAQTSHRSQSGARHHSARHRRDRHADAGRCLRPRARASDRRGRSRRAATRARCTSTARTATGSRRRRRAPRAAAGPRARAGAGGRAARG